MNMKMQTWRERCNILIVQDNKDKCTNGKLIRKSKKYNICFEERKDNI